MPEESTAPDLEQLSQRLVDACNRRDFDAAASIFTTGAVWDRGLEVFEGRKAIRIGLEDWIGVYDDFEQVVQEFRDFGGGVGFGVFLQRGRLRGSGGFLELRYANVAAWTDGLIERMTSYAEIDDGRGAGERLAQERTQQTSSEF
jgi:ketosteroid isomerase-like protein